MHRAIAICQTCNYNDACIALANLLPKFGSGDCGTAFETEDNKIIKVHMKKDKAYVSFVKFIMSLRDRFPEASFLKHFPVVYSYSETDACIILEMEKLTHYGNLLQVDNLCKLISPKAKSVPEAMVIARGRMVYKVNRAMDREYLVTQYQKYRVTPTLEDAFNVLLIEVYANDFCVDIHDDNILFRVNNDEIEPVIIDPFN
jgi:hypothetical protein